MTPTIYRIEFPDGSFYIGATVHFAERRRTHLRHARKARSVNRLLQAKFDQYPICGIYQVASGFARETLHALEQLVVAQERPPLNVAAPTRLPASNEGRSKPWGPWVCLRDAAAALRLSYSGVKKLAARYTYEEYTLDADSRRQRVEQVRECQRRGFSVSAYQRWVRLGFSHDQALAAEDEVRKRKITVDGRTRTLREWAQHSGVPLNTLYQRLHAGWTEREAVGVDPRPIAQKRAENKAHRAARPTRQQDDIDQALYALVSRT
jgi:hypothetical protein